MAASPVERYGFIGLGNMGFGMAGSIARAGLPLMVHDLRSEPMQALVEDGARSTSSLQELVDYADSIHICVIYGEQVLDLVLGPGGILEASQPGKVIVIHSTVATNVVIECATAATEVGVQVLDCPMSGGEVLAREGKLTLMVGGDGETIDRCRAGLEAMGTTIFRVGAVGSGQAVKLANNVMSHGNRLVYMEAVQLAEAFGIDEELLNEVVAESTGMSASQLNHARHDSYGKTHTLAGTPELPFRFGKDLRLATELALQEKLSMPMTALGAQIAPGAYRARWEQLAGDDANQ